MAKKILKLSSLTAAGLFAAGLMGCSEDNTAGVFTETESGQQASVDVNGDKLVMVEDCSTSIPNNLKKAKNNCIIIKRTYAIVDVQGTAVDEDGDALKSARVLLKFDNNIDEAKEVTTDENGVYKFEQIIYKTTYNGFAPPSQNVQQVDDTTFVEYTSYTLQIISDDETLGSYETVTFENSKRVTEGEEVYLEVPEQMVHKTVNAEMKTYGYQKGSRVCLDYSGICHILTAEEAEAGSFTMENVPEGFYYNLCSIQTEGDITESRCAILDEILVTKPVADTLSYVLSADVLSFLDSLQDKSIPNVLVRFKSSADDPLLVGRNFSKPTVTHDNEKFFWAGISFNGADTATYKLLENTPSDLESAVLIAEREIQDSVIPNAISNNARNNIGFSFRISSDETDSEQELVILSTVDSVDGKAIGYEVRQCEAGSKNVCVRVYSGLDSAATDTTVYGKSSILDGEEHMFSMVVTGTHLAIAVDGKILRDTDLKVHENFGKLNTSRNVVTIGNTTLNDFLMFSMDKDIRNKGETNWNRLKAWLIAHQQLNK